MRKLEYLIRFENANSALAFRKTPYAADDRESLLVDVLALANARTDGPRYLILGVDDGDGGKRGLKGVRRKALPSLMSAYRKTVNAYVEPSLALSLRSVPVLNRTVAVLVLPSCTEPPYVLRNDVSERLQKGDSWIRRGTQQARLGRADLKSLLATQTLTGTGGCEIQVAFDNSSLTSTLRLPVLALNAKPSDQARARIKGMLDAKMAAHARLGRTDTWLDRLAFARAHGADQPYDTVSPMSLLAKLSDSRREHAAADRYYENELRAHQVNLAVLNVGDGPLTNAVLTVDVPGTGGVAIADQLHPPVGVAVDEFGTGYPAVEQRRGATRVVASIGNVFPGARISAYKQALRLLLREAAAGKTVTFNYTVTGEELREPVTGSLSVRVSARD